MHAMKPEPTPRIKSSPQISHPSSSTHRSSSRRDSLEINRGRMTASVCDMSTVVRSRSRKISRDLPKRTARSLSRAGHRSKSRPRGDDNYSKSSRQYSRENAAGSSRGRGKICRPDTERIDASDPSLFSKDGTGNQEGKAKSRSRYVPPPPARKSIGDGQASRKSTQKLNSSHGSADAESNLTDSTHPSSSLNSSGHDNITSGASVPYGANQEKNLPLPPSPKTRQRSRSRTRSHSKPTHARSKSCRSQRSQSRLSRSVPCNDLNESYINDSNYARSTSKSRTSRHSGETRRSVDLDDVERSLDSTRSKSKGRSASKCKRRATTDSANTKSSRDLSHRNSSSPSHPIARSYKQIDHSANNFNDTASFSPIRDNQRSHRRSRSTQSSWSHKKTTDGPSSRQPREDSRSRGRQYTSLEASDLLSNPVSSISDESPNLFIEDGSGSFSIPTLYTNASGSTETHMQLFTVQLNEPSREFFIQTSMGHLHKIREIHPKTNILRTLSYWNSLQKRRHHNMDGQTRGGGQLGISRTDCNNKQEVIMTLVGKYHNRDWEYDEDFHIVLEKFVEDALRFHACLNGPDHNEANEVQRKKKGMRLGSLGGSSTSGSHSKFGNSASPNGSNEEWVGKKVWGKVMEKITG